jgi:hypothetical protein
MLHLHSPAQNDIFWTGIFQIHHCFMKTNHLWAPSMMGISWEYTWGKLHRQAGSPELTKDVRKLALCWGVTNWGLTFFGWLVVWNLSILYDFPIILGMSSSQLTPSFFRGVGLNHQPDWVLLKIYVSTKKNQGCPEELATWMMDDGSRWDFTINNGVSDGTHSKKG